MSVHVLGIFEHANEPTKCIYIIREYIHTIFENKMPKFYFFSKDHQSSIYFEEGVHVDIHFFLQRSIYLKWSRRALNLILKAKICMLPNIGVRGFFFKFKY